MNIGANLKAYRRKLGITQAELYLRCGVSITTISSIENGHSDGATGTLLKLADALGVTIDDIIRENDNGGRNDAN